MTQEKANKIFATELGQQLNVIYVTSDDQPFIRYEEAVLHTQKNKLLNIDVDTSITEWYPEDLIAQQTAVEWLIKQINQDYPEMTWAYKEECKQAKQIEKEQIIDAFDIGTSDKDRIGSEYYNETYTK
jgi:hypothetical protein